MEKRDKVKLNVATMQGLILCPTLVVILDNTKQSGVNIITVSYVGVICENPPLIGLAIRPTRYSHKLICKAREFTVNLPTIKLLGAIDFCGSRSGRKIDKAEAFNLHLAKATIIKTPVIEAAPLNLECRLLKILRFSQHKASHDYFMAEVVAIGKKKGFNIEKEQLLVTTNYDYRLVADKLGKAFEISQQGKVGKSHAVSRKKV
jgi:flavin reductase (DIM6/NTAB) family NADH-FMN oxidoreductase RutF